MYAIPKAWVALTAFSANGLKGDYARPTDGKATAFLYRAIAGGTTGASEPAWPLNPGGTVQDGTVTWAWAGVAPIISLQDLEDRASRAVVRAILDDNQDGFADGGPIARAVADATSYVIGLIGGVYDFPINSPYPNEVQRICLDVAVGYLYVRHPEVARFDGHAMLDRARAELKDLKNGISQMDIPLLGVSQTGGPALPPAPVEPRAHNIGAMVVDGSHRLVINDASGTENGGDF